MRPVSAKRRQQNAIRRRLLEQMREGSPYCVIPGCGRFFDDGHEVKTRARGGSFLDKDNVVGLCRPHHTWVTEHPLEAHEMGLMKHGWDS